MYTAFLRLISKPYAVLFKASVSSQLIMASSVSEEKLAESIKDLRIDNVNIQKESINSDDETWNELKLVGVPLEVKEDTPVVEVKEYSNHEKHRKEINDVHSLSNQKSSTQESDDERESEDEDESSEPNRLRKRSEVNLIPFFNLLTIL